MNLNAVRIIRIKPIRRDIMNKKTMNAAEIFEELFARYPALDICRDDINKAFLLLKET